MSIINTELTSVGLHGLSVFGDEGQGSVVLLVLKHIDALEDIAHQEEVLETVDLVDVDVGVNEGDAVEVLVLELPDVDLLTHRGHQEAGHG